MSHKLSEKLVARNSLQAWLLASRPKTLAAAVAPVLIGSALAVYYNAFLWIPALCCLFFAMAMQIAANLINDLFDYLKGADREDRLGPERVTAQGWVAVPAIKTAIVLVVLLGCLSGLPLLYYGGWQMMIVGAVCVLFAYCYTSGPFPLAYNGLGDAAVVVFFGIVPVGFTFYVQAKDWTFLVTLLGIATGLVVNTLLVLNNYRDRDTDRRSHKRTLIVRFGERFGVWLYFLSGVLAVALVWTAFAGIGRYAAPALVSLYLLPHFITWHKMLRIREGSALNALLGETSRNMLFFALLLFLALIICK
ncbi:MAG: 1,4-dihydroxy-2-naphthoate octaprenyltransferase [Prevotellaceae bacterium]|nr:1,4-dihydroxy-2-naphthoate octaprenyltransferase [Prevotellaceae bacterium]